MEERFAPPRRAGAVEVLVSETALRDIARRVQENAVFPARAAPAGSGGAGFVAPAAGRRSAHRAALPGALAQGRSGALSVPAETCRRVVEDMDGRAILADEVGLGKTRRGGHDPETSTCCGDWCAGPWCWRRRP